MASAQIQVSDTAIINCTDTEEVSSKLIEAAVNFLMNNIENNDREYAGKLQSDISNAVKNLQDITKNVANLLQNDKSSDIDVRTFDNLFFPLWRQLRTGIQLCVGEGSELRENKNQICEPLRKRVNKIFSEAENGQSFPFDSSVLSEKIAAFGGIPAAYQDSLDQLRTSLSRRMQEDMDDILNEVLTTMKDKFGDVLGILGRLEKRFNSANHELLGKLIRHIRDGRYEDDMPTITYGLELLDSFRLNYRSFAQHRIRKALSCLDPMDKDFMPNILQDVYEQAIYELRKKFDGTNGIYPEPNSAAFAIAEEFKDIMIRSGTEEQLMNEWRRFYWPIRGDIWPNEYGNSQKRRDAYARMREPLQDILKVLDNSSNFIFTK